MSDVRWLADHREDGQIVFRIGRLGEQLIAEWIDLATLTASRDGATHRFDIAPSAGWDDAEKVRRGSAALLLRQLQGKLAFHGAAVVIGTRAIALFGRSGQGKSTLAASLCSCAGAALLSDDAVAVDQDAATYYAAPMEANHWLADDDGGKRPVPATLVANERAPLCAIVDLKFAEVDRPRLLKLSGVDAIAVLVPQVARFIVDDRLVQERELDALAALTSRVGIYRLERPRDRARIEQSYALLEAIMKGAP